LIAMQGYLAKMPWQACKVPCCAFLLCCKRFPSAFQALSRASYPCAIKCLRSGERWNRYTIVKPNIDSKQQWLISFL
jgi:hypothetical protein